MNITDFRARFPEFRSTGDVQVLGALADATAGVSSEIYGHRASEAAGYLAAHKLATSPMGKSSRLEDDASQTTYWKELVRIRREVAPRWLLT